MTVFNIHKNKAICVLPWVHEHKDIEGNIRACCKSKKILKHRSIKDIRKEMLEGTQPSECAKCFKEEENKESSSRIIETVNWVKKFGEPDINNQKIEFLDVRNDPTCNLKCKTCNPIESTLWAKEKNIKPVVPKNDLHKYDKKQLKKVYLAGGEPTYNKNYYIFLKELLQVNPQCEVLINTNLKRLSSEWKDIIKSFKNLTVIISCDATMQLGSYVRYPLGWNQFEDNVKFVKKYANFVQFNLVPSNLTVHSIDLTINWMNKYTNAISISIVNGDHWTHKAVPMKYREKYIASLNRIKNNKVNPWLAFQYRKNIASLINKYESDDYDENLHKRLRAEIAEQDSHRTLQLKDVDPFLYSWIFG